MLHLMSAEQKSPFRRSTVMSSGRSASAVSQSASKPVQSALWCAQRVFRILLGLWPLIVTVMIIG